MAITVFRFLAGRRFILAGGVFGSFSTERRQAVFHFLVNFFVSLGIVALGHSAIAGLDAAMAGKPGVAASVGEADVFPGHAKNMVPTSTLVFTEVEPFASSLALFAFAAQPMRFGVVSAAVAGFER